MNTPADRMIALSAANAITSRTAATWHPLLPRDPRVLVPIHLDVLMVRQAGGAWANCAMKVPQDTGQVQDCSKLMPEPFDELQQTRPAGAYLRWAVPDALSAGKQDGDTATFPALPDRWLVLRIYPSPTTKNRRTIRGWVLQAGDAVPVVTDLDSWIEPGKPADVKKPLTVFGHGDMAWQAYYDNVVNRLGFYDNLSDVPNGPIAYLVCGWYSDSSLDPLGDTDIHSLADFDLKMQQLAWSLDDKNFHQAARRAIRHRVAASKAGLGTRLSAAAQARATLPFDARAFSKPEPGSVPDGPPYTTDGSWWPQNSLYHGSVRGIGWPGIGWEGNEKGLLSEEQGGPPSADKINIAVGCTLPEALSKLVANATGSTKEGRILEAFLLGMLPELDEPDGQARLDALLQSSAFGSLPGGKTTERVWQPPTGQPPVSAPGADKPGAGVFERYQSTARTPGKIKKPAPPASKQGPVNAQIFQAKSFAQEANLSQGRLGAVINQVAPVEQEPYVPGKWVDADRSLPRLFHPTDPVVLLQGLQRSFQYGADGRFSTDGTLQCRLTGECQHEYCKQTGDIVWPPIHPEDVLDRGVENGSVPPECDELLGEVAITDPGAAAPMVDNVTQNMQLTPTRRATEIRNVTVDQTAWWATRDPRIDSGPLVSRTAYAGTLPSPVSVGLPVNPWSPAHLDWSVEYIPSAGGVPDWNLGEIDFDESLPQLPPQANAPGAIQLQGRSPLHAGASTMASLAVNKTLDQIKRTAGAGQLSGQLQVVQFVSDLAMQLLASAGQLQMNPSNLPDPNQALLEDVASALESMDVLGAGFNTLHLQLRGGFPGDGTSKPQAGDPKPSPFFPMRAGFIRVLRLRLVDGFGQFVDLAGSSKAANADPSKILRSEPLDVTGRPELLALPPRFTAPARLSFRYMDAAGSPNEAALATDISPGYSPVCGYVMPNHLDSALEFFGSDGSNAGVVRPADDGTILWEDAPGQPSTVGQSPSRALSNPFLASIAEALIRWGVVDAGLPAEKDTALQGLLRVIDSTLWTIDPFGHAGDEHLSLLVGHPVAVMRALLRLELQEPVDMTSALQIKVPVRLGALAHWQDGLLGYFVNDDYNKLYCSDAAAAGLARDIGPGVGFLQQANLVQSYYDSFGSDGAANPVNHPYIDTSGTMWIYPNQDVKLTLLVEPHTVVNATTGLLPRKDIGMRREWVTAALAKIAPTFRFGPVLVDPLRIRMPIAAELNGSWTWDHRTDVITWKNDPVTHATQDAILSPDPPAGSEGWLQLNPPEPGATK